jgi:hypothetical protein
VHWILLQTDYIFLHSRLTKLLKVLEDDAEVVEASNVDELVEQFQLGVIIVMRRDISLEIFLFRYILGVPIV